MEEKIPYSQRTFRGKYKYSMLVFGLLLTVALMLWIVTFRGYQMAAIAKHNIIVDAPIVDYHIVRHSATRPETIEIRYHYRYESEDGVVYEGDCGAYIHDYETADNAIASGETVKIYIDGKGHCFKASTDISFTKRITLLIISIVLTIGAAVFFIIFLIPIKPKQKTL